MSPPRHIAHVDMDAFFASVEIRDDPTLRGRPVLVGFAGKRGVVAAASYEARRFGCHSAQPMAIALRKCPHAAVVAPRHERYVEVSRSVFEVFSRFTPIVEGLSIDEAFLDLAGTQRLHGSPRAIAESIRAIVRGELNLTCSVGLATSKFIAKIASDRDKPDGLTEVPPGHERAFLAPLPIRQLWGVGPKTAQTLQRLGIATVGDIAEFGAATLEQELGDHGLHLHRLSLGIDEREVTPGRERKQISHENTFETDLTSRAEIEDWLLRQATRVGDQLAAKQLRGRKVHIKLRDTAFTTWTRQTTLDLPSAQTKAIFAAARGLLDKLDAEGLVRGRRFRLTGLGVSELVGAHEPGPPKQLELLGLGATPDDTTRSAPVPELPDKGEAVQDVLSEVRRRFGGKALSPAGVSGRRKPR
ncbi:DNA polymerase IV [Enhygromyxa salina]|uniref:DNA polymerase IV n=1 Tax=Enhygromyxa salina TaxID=215803 RepID=A0A0C1ZXT8_9BACT|nr:DNA polymerase IV [Enhygromyxa salina]KIG16048.1 DNA polymerase IV [Enhygromyxa salina]